MRNVATITSVREYDTEYSLSYGSHGCNITKNELCGFVPRVGHSIVVDTDNRNTVIGIRISGRIFR